MVIVIRNTVSMYCLVINSSNQKEYVHIPNNSIVRQQNKRYILLAEQQQVIEEAL